MEVKSATPLTWRNYSGVAAEFGRRVPITLLVGGCACGFIVLLRDELGRLPPGDLALLWMAWLERVFPTLLTACVGLTLVAAGVQAAIAVWALLAARATARRSRGGLPKSVRSNQSHCDLVPKPVRPEGAE